MNHTHNSNIHLARADLILVLAILTAIWLVGCADPRTEPLQSGGQGHTETLVLWDHAVSNGTIVSAGFTLADTLAPITNPSEDTPARLTAVAYVRPDCQILRREQIVNDSIPWINDNRIFPALLGIDAIKQTLDSLGKARLDSIERIQRVHVQLSTGMVDSTHFQTSFGGITCDTALYAWVVDPSGGASDTLWARRDSILNLLPDSIRYFEDQVVAARIDTAVLGFERDDLALIVDNRYTLALWLDDTSEDPAYPEATYDTLGNGRLTGQAIYLAATHTTPTDPLGYKERGFHLALNQFESADPNNPGYMREINWATCFPGSERPCLQPGVPHTLYGRVTGADTRITATLVLVYERPTP